MKKYSVRIYYSTFMDVEVEADNRFEAISAAYDEPTDNEQLINNAVTIDGDETIKEIE